MQLVFVINRVPNNTGTGEEASTKVVSTLSGFGVDGTVGLGRNRYDNTVRATHATNCHIVYTKSNGFLEGKYGSPP